jgi:hypothetical protein
MTALALTLFAASTYAIWHVAARTLAPALPRIVAILRGQS